MSYPSISQWIDTVSNSFGRFRTLGEFELCRDAYGNIRFIAGNSAVVFPVIADGKMIMLNCFIKEGRCRDVLYATTSCADPLLSPAVFLPGEAYVYDEMGNGQYYDIAVGRWIEGNTLETELRRAFRESGADRFAELATIFDSMAAELLSRDWAHGDLKPENIIITPEGHAVLIDYDAMYVPGGEPSGETGTPGYQHPARTAADFNARLDDYPAALISTALHALALDPSLGERHAACDGLLFTPQRILRGRDETYREVIALFERCGMALRYRMARLLASPTPELFGLAALLTEAVRETTPECPTNQPDAGAEPPELFVENGRWGFRTPQRVVVAPLYDNGFDFTEGLAAVQLGRTWHFIGPDGRVRLNCPEYESVKPFRNGRAKVICNGHRLEIDSAGREYEERQEPAEGEGDRESTPVQ